MNIKKIFTYAIVFLLLFQSTLEFLIDNPIVSYIDEIFIAIVFCVALIHIFKSRVISKKSVVILVLVIIFIFVGFFSAILNSDYLIQNVILSSLLACKFFLLIFSLSNITFSDSIEKYVLSAIKFIGIVCLIVAVINILLPNIYFKIFPFAIQDYRMGFLCITSIFYHPGIYGWFMFLVSLIYYSQYIFNGKKKDLYLALTYILLSVLCFRTKVIISIVVIIFYQLIVKKKINFKQMIIIAILGLIIFLVFGNLLEKTYNLYILNSSGEPTARRALVDNSFILMKNYFPLGVGFGKYGSWYSSVNYSEVYYKMGMNTIWGLTPQNHPYVTDTFWPSIMGETGVLGTIIYIIIIIYIYNMLFNYYKNNSSKYSFFSLMIFIQLICESLGAPSFNSSPQNIIVGLNIGIVISIMLKNKKMEGS